MGPAASESWAATVAAGPVRRVLPARLAGLLPARRRRHWQRTGGRGKPVTLSLTTFSGVAVSTTVTVLLVNIDSGDLTHCGKWPRSVLPRDCGLRTAVCHTLKFKLAVTSLRTGVQRKAGNLNFCFDVF